MSYQIENAAQFNKSVNNLVTRDGLQLERAMAAIRYCVDQYNTHSNLSPVALLMTKVKQSSLADKPKLTRYVKAHLPCSLRWKPKENKYYVSKNDDTPNHFSLPLDGNQIVDYRAWKPEPKVDERSEVEKLLEKFNKLEPAERDQFLEQITA